MPTPGYVFKDGGPIPDDELEGQKPNEQDTPGYTASSARPASTSTESPLNTPTSTLSTSNAPTDSHVLAEAEHDEKGATQHEHFEHEVRDLGWNDHPDDIPTPLVGGLPNEELWLLVRRFDKQMYHVKAIKGHIPGGLDLNIADEDEFSPDKLRATVERLYMTVIVGLIGFGKHIARLRSWREPRRTAGFCAAYFLAWILNLTTPLILTTLLTLIVYPPARKFLFPHAPLALVNGNTGGIQSPAAGVLGSHDSVTGAPEKYQGEAVEQEASNFVSGFASIALSSATGKHEQGDPESDQLSSSIPDPTKAALAGADAKVSSGGGIPTKHHDKTKQPMEDAMWSKMRPIMHALGDIADGWERFANALSPTAPYPKEAPRLKLGAILVPALAISLLTTSAMFAKMTTFFVGFGFFADPIIWRAASWLNHEFPNWQKLLELRNTILKGIPTNAQLTITLLRVGERNKAPLPPPPTSDKPLADHAAELDKESLTLDASHDEIHDAITADPSATIDGPHPDNKPKKKHGARVMNFLKGTAKSGVEAKLGIDSVRAAIGSTHARNHLGILPKPAELTPSGPVDFRARYEGHKGWVYVSTSATTPCVGFTTHAPKAGSGQDAAAMGERLRPVFSIPIDDISAIKKVGGVGWKARLVVGWATGRNVADGLEITGRDGRVWKVTAMTLRDELFNRLVAMGSQMWESW